MGLDVYLEEGEDLPLDKAGDGSLHDEGEDDHLFKRDYLRSSYNNSGFDRVVDALTGKAGLWYIFEPCGDLKSGHVAPSTEQLQLAHKRAMEVLEELQGADPTYVTFEGANPYRDKDDEKIHSAYAALKLYHETMDERSESPFGGGFRNRNGSFWTEPLKIYAAIPGIGPLNQPGVWLVYDIEDMGWYIDAAQKVIEFIDTALEMSSPQITWSY